MTHLLLTDTIEDDMKKYSQKGYTLYPRQVFNRSLTDDLATPRGSLSRVILPPKIKKGLDMDLQTLGISNQNQEG